eukprot:10783813-Heterocapsa_arctica.AAC.1
MANAGQGNAGGGCQAPLAVMVSGPERGTGASVTILCATIEGNLSCGLICVDPSDMVRTGDRDFDAAQNGN